jgi:acetyl-CoA acetyltransferase
MRVSEQQSIISGIGQSAVGRRLGRSDLDLTLEACLAAIDDAGLTREDIDGLVTFPGRVNVPPAGFTGPGTDEVQDALRLELNYRLSSFDGPGQLQAVVNACLAVAGGLARHVLVYRTVTESSGAGAGLPESARSASARRPATRTGGPMGWQVPMGAFSTVNMMAMMAQRHFFDYGTTKEQLGWIPVIQRAHAALNPIAVLRDPMSMSDYLDARMISTPLGLFDCDIPVDASTAFVVSHRDFAPDARHHPVHVNALGTASRNRASWDQYPDLSSMAAVGAAAHMWSRTDLRPEDIDTAHLYDGFSILAMIWMESLGLCPTGEAGRFIEGGARITYGGDFVLNPNGGQLSAGRAHGFGHILEAVIQLRHDAGARQAADAEVAVVSNGAGPIVGCMLLTRGDR